MRIKAADDRQPQINVLTALLSRADVSGPTRHRIEQEIRRIEAGQRGEAQAAYLIDFHYARDPNAMTIHDLRINCDGRVAQIDHLIITPPLDFWVCESKTFVEGVEINEQGEWSVSSGGRKRGIQSPIEQNKRHITVLKDVFARRLVTMPTRLGLTFKATLRSLVLVSDRAQITRPQGTASERVEGLESVIKADQLKTKIDKSSAERTLPSTPTALSNAEAIESVARQLAALHSPANYAWARRFGLPEQASGQQGPYAPTPTPLARIVFPGMSGSGGSRVQALPHCESCGDVVSSAVVNYCRDNEALFEGSILCVPCQDEFYPGRY
jgi:nuclease-like protein